MASTIDIGSAHGGSVITFKAGRSAFVKPLTPRRTLLLQPATILAILSRPHYASTPERLWHWHHINSLAHEMQQPIGAVKLLYENALMHLKPNAKVQNFLPIFVSKQLKRRVAVRP